MTLSLRRISYALGAEVIGCDMSQPMDDDTFAQINQAFLEHHVLLFRGREITREQHIAFSRRFGQLAAGHKPESNVPGLPELFLVQSKPKPDGAAATKDINGKEWHTDHSHNIAPAGPSLLRAVELPEVGGNTLFANLYLAYDNLSAGMKQLLEGLHGLHFQGSAYKDPALSGEEIRRRFPNASHPLVRVHPETGRKALFVNQQIRWIEGMTAAETRPLVDFLTEHATRPQFVYRHQWQKNDLVMWDNRCLLHMALSDYDRRQLRHMERTTVIGQPSGRAYNGPLN